MGWTYNRCAMKGRWASQEVELYLDGGLERQVDYNRSWTGPECGLYLEYSLNRVADHAKRWTRLQGGLDQNMDYGLYL